MSIATAIAGSLKQTLRTVLGAARATVAEAPSSAESEKTPPTGPAGPLIGRSFDDEMAGAGGFAAWHERRRREKRQVVEAALGRIGALAERAPGHVRQTLDMAHDVAEHSFNFLGSGPFVPADPDRPAGADGYQPIDWFLDPVRRLRFPNDVPHKDWNLFEMRPGNADIKYPWELSRCQHLLALGQAYLLARQGDGGKDDRAGDAFAAEILDQCEDFITANPIGIAINWTCTMDVALRVANWCFALALIKDCRALPPERLERVYRHLFDTGLFIVANLENHYEVTSNHFLSNIVGLHVLAGEFCDLEIGRRWDAYCRQCLEEEIVVQMLDDGADYESSVPYHRLVAELFLGSWQLAQIQKHPLSPAYGVRLERAVDLLAGVLRPDGLMPVIGDCDDGRLMIAAGYGCWDPRDGRHLMAAAAGALEKPRWLAHCGGHAGAADAVWEAFWWGVEPDALTELHATVDGPPEAESRLFADAGIVVSRSFDGGGSYLAVSNGIVGTSGFGNHKHNDLLSFEYFDRGQALIVDPGSYVYTSDFDARNQFRSTPWHNTIVIDGVEQNEFRPEWIFRMFEKARPSHIRFEDLDADTMVYEGSHDGYQVRLDDGVVHNRRFTHERTSGRLSIEDRLEGRGTHEARWHFHFAPGVSPRLCDGATGLDLEAGGCHWRLEWDDQTFVADLIESSISPSYGVRVESRALRLSAGLDLGGNEEMTPGSSGNFAVTLTRLED